jgi:hypothetical protein
LNNHKGPRRFEAKWLREPQFREVVERAWGEVGHQSGGVLGKLNKVHAIMHAWNDSVLKQPKKKIRQAQRELEKAMTGHITDESKARAKEMSNLIELLLEQEEIYWSQARSDQEPIGSSIGTEILPSFTILHPPDVRKFSFRNSRMIMING